MTQSTVVTVAAGTSATGGSARKPTASRGKTAQGVSKARPKVADKELVEALSMGLSVILAGFFQFVVRFPRDVRDQLDPTTDEADAFVTPFARLINRPSFGNLPSAIVGGADWMVSLAAAMAYQDRVAPILRAQKNSRASQPSKKITRQESTNGNVRPSEESSFVAVPGVGYGIGPQQFVE